MTKRKSLLMSDAHIKWNNKENGSRSIELAKLFQAYLWQEDRKRAERFIKRSGFYRYMAKPDD